MVRMSVKKLDNVVLTEAQHQYDLLVPAVHAVTDRANPLLKTTFKTLRRVTVCPLRIGAITKATLALLYLEHGQPLPAHHTS